MSSDLSDRSTETALPTRGSGAAVLLTASGLAAAFAVASCCGLPFLLATLGVGTAWLYGVAVLHRIGRSCSLSRLSALPAAPSSWCASVGRLPSAPRAEFAPSLRFAA
jgi:hypothetical protein